MVVLFYSLVLGLQFYLSSKMLGSLRALIPAVITFSCGAPEDVFAGLSSADHEAWTSAIIIFVAPVVVVYLLGTIGAKISSVRHKLRPLLFVVWVIAVWGGAALFVLNGYTRFYSP
jgi:hypothetical protein